MKETEAPQAEAVANRCTLKAGAPDWDLIPRCEHQYIIPTVDNSFYQISKALINCVKVSYKQITSQESNQLKEATDIPSYQKAY